MPDNQQNLYRDMEVVYKPAVQRLRDDMQRIRDLAQEIALLAASHDYPEIATPTPILATDGCICKGNWRDIVKKSAHLIGRKYIEAPGGKVFTFFGIVHGNDDYYYGMSRRGGVRLLSCVGSIEGFGFALIDTGTEVTKGTTRSHTDHPYRHFDRTCPACVASVYEQVDLDHERKGD